MEDLGQMPPLDGGVQYHTPYSQNNGNMIVLTDPEEELERLEATLRGQVIGTDGKTRPVSYAKMNELGIITIMSHVRAIVSRVTFMSNMKHQEVESFSEYLAESLIKSLMINKNRFGIRSNTDRDEILFTCVVRAYISMTRGRQGDDKRFFKGSTQEISYGMTGNQPNKGGGLGSLIPGGWRQ